MSLLNGSFDYAFGFCCVDSLTVAVIPKRPVGVETYDDDDDDEELVWCFNS